MVGSQGFLGQAAEHRDGGSPSCKRGHSPDRHPLFAHVAPSPRSAVRPCGTATLGGRELVALGARCLVSGGCLPEPQRERRADLCRAAPYRFKSSPARTPTFVYVWRSTLSIATPKCVPPL